MSLPCPPWMWQETLMLVLNRHLLMGLFLVIKTLSSRTWKLKASWTNIHHILNLDVSVNFCLVRIVLLKLYSITLDVTPSLLNMSLHTYAPSKPKASMNGLKLEKQLTLYSFMTCVHHLHLVLPHLLIFVLLIKHTVPTNIFVHMDTWLRSAHVGSSIQLLKNQIQRKMNKLGMYNIKRDHITSGKKNPDILTGLKTLTSLLVPWF